jgi:hypothetical protein
MKSLSLARGRPISLANSRPAMASDQDVGSAERVKLYHSARWLKARRRSLAEHPLCVECEQAGRIVASNVTFWVLSRPVLRGGLCARRFPASLRIFLELSNDA